MNKDLSTRTEKPNCYFINDGQTPDYRIKWYDLSNLNVRECTVYFYENDEEIILSIFNLLYPRSNILSIEAIGKNVGETD